MPATNEEEWLEVALATGPADRAAAEAGVRIAYQAAGLAEPERFVWCESPRSAALAAAALVTDEPGTRSVRAAVRTRPWARARAEATDRLGHTGWAAHWAATSQRNWRLVTDRLVTPLRRRLDDEFTPDGSGDVPVVDRMVLLDAVHGQHDAAWLGAHLGDAEPGDAQQGDAQPGDTNLAGLVQVARAAGWWWPYERVVVLSERPVALHRDNLGRLHHGDGPALSYPDGWGLHAWRGMPIPPDVAAQLPTVTAARIQTEENAEIRRVMLEYFGFERYLRESNAERLHADECGVLWRVELPADEPLVMVEVVNSTPEPDGSRRTYFLRVPPETERAREGVAWTFGLTEDEYQPLAQT